jgi:hypothetical protein
MTDKSIEVFQNLHLKGRSSASSIRAGTLAQVQAPWHHDQEREEDIRGHASDGEDVIVLVRDEFDDVDESGMVLWQEGEGYRVSNIVPAMSVNSASPSTTPSCGISSPGLQSLRPAPVASTLS